MRIGFLVDVWEHPEAEQSSTILLMQEAWLRGHTVFLFHAQHLTVRNNIVHCFVKKIKDAKKYTGRPFPFYNKVVFEEQLVPLYALDCIFVRKEPPVRPMVMNFLDSIQHETFIINDINGLRKANNKLYTTTFHDPDNSFLPITHVSKSKEYLKKMIDESPHNKFIIKPLDGSKGRGVIVVEKKAKTNLNSLLDFYLDNNNDNYVILQEYIDAVQEGDIRVMMLNGNPIGAYRRIPAEGEVRANINVGGTAEKYVLTDDQKRLCKKIGQKLVADGLFFVGLDLIGNKLIEVNVHNPGGISNINRLSNVKLHKLVLNFLEDKVKEREDRRAELAFNLRRFNELRTNNLSSL